MKKYTYREILDKIAVLQEFFAIVRLVSPLTCAIAEIVEQDGQYHMEYTNDCFEVWNTGRQCANCTSARALQNNDRYSKCEVLEDTIYHINSFPVEIEGNALVLELVQPVHHDTANDRSSNLCHSMMSEITDINQNILTDNETHAYNRFYLLEHLPFILSKAQKTQLGSACMIQIRQFREINNSYGRMAGLGLICTLHNILKQAFSILTDTYLVRYSEDTFVVLNTSLPYTEFTKTVARIKEEYVPPHILFQNGQIPFSLRLTCADLCNKAITGEDSLIEQLQTADEE